MGVTAHHLPDKTYKVRRQEAENDAISCDLVFVKVPDDIGGRATAFLFIFWDLVPGEDQPPVEPTNLRFTRVAQILEGVPVYHINDGAHYGCRLLFDPDEGREKLLTRGKE